MPRKSKTDPDKLTPDEIRVAIDRLSRRIVTESGGQAACDRLEAELQTLLRRLPETAFEPRNRTITAPKQPHK